MTTTSSEYQLHPRQHEAIYTHDRNLIVVAGAGSGKTRVLVERFIALLDAHPEWPLASLVAITFTQKAAREMRDRVRREIENRITRINPDDTAAIQHWRDHYAALDSARIGTIHSLCAAILRANAAEAQIDPGFTLLDEIESAIVADDAVEEALSKVVETESPAIRLLVEYEVEKVRSTVRAHIFTDVDRLPPEEPPADRIAREHANFAAHVQTMLTDIWSKGLAHALAWMPPSGWPAADDPLLSAWEIVHEGHQRLTQISGNGTDDAETMLGVLTRWSTEIVLRGGSAKLWGDKGVVDECKAMLTLIRDMARQTLATIGEPIGETDQQEAELLPLWGMAIRTAQQVYTDLKRDRRALDFTDLETLTRHLLLNFPDVCARYRDAEFKHILVDEFQDTNAAQRDIIYALAGADRAGSLFVVGDPKQSIYQFRGADVSVFNAVREDILTRNGHEVSLNVSFRTHRMLIDGFNTIFQRVLGTDVHERFEVAFGEPMEADRPSEEHHAPTLEVLMIDSANADGKRNRADELRQWEAWELAQRIQHLIAAKKPVWDKEQKTYRPLQYGDIAVLFRATKSMALVEDAFKQLAIPYITFAGKGFYDRPEVWDLMNLLRVLYNTADDLSLAAALRSPLFSFSDDDLLALRWQRAEGQRIPLWTAVTDTTLTYDPALSSTDRLRFAGEVLLRLHSVAGRVTIAELLTRALNETGFMAAQLGLPDGVRRVGNVEKLLEIARHSGRIGLGEFTTYLQDLTDREVRESEALVEAENLVRLMTIHASKGLEFPIVALFDAAWERFGGGPLLMLDPVFGAACSVQDGASNTFKPFAYRQAEHYADLREAAEDKRLLYVALTRAQDYLIVSGRKSSKNESATWLDQLIGALELPTNIAPDTERLVNTAWGSVLVRVPDKQPDRAVIAPREQQAASAWEELDAAPIPATTIAPPLLQPVKIDVQAPVRLLDSKELARLGEMKPDLQRFRDQLLHNAPAEIRTIATAELPSLTGRLVGEIVHAALRYNRLPGNQPDLDEILRNYAWEHGIASDEELNQTVQACHELLRRIEDTWIIKQIRSAEQVYRELPFSLRTSERTINGVMDVLFFAHQQWHVVDYKTNYVKLEEGQDRIPALTEHAKRFHQQVGVYAAAVEQKFGQAPQVHLHYIRYMYTVNIEEPVWKRALMQMETDIRDAMV
ncbi:MAG: UvrD-helicase domain-containing protein [Anaerolineae bacterium]|nr:UvrD-helicase domain-containing protein [Anaerolineae bacterium]